MDENLLIYSAKNGDLEAFNQLVLAYQTLIYNQAYRMLGDPFEAEDVTQMTFIRAFEKLTKHRGGSFRAWLLRIATNICYDELRRRKSRPSTALEPLNEYDDEWADPRWMADESALPETHMERVELNESIQHSLEQLPPAYRAVLTLVDIQELSYTETADVLHLPVGTVKSRLARGRQMMRAHLLASPSKPVESFSMATRNTEILLLIPSD